MEVNNRCNTLIVYGSYVPGEIHHGVFSDIPGNWVKGKILKKLIDAPDGIGPGEEDEVEAWTIEFSDCNAEMFTPEYDVQERLLHKHWTILDEAMGNNWARSQERWWPADSAHEVAKNGMIVVNIYVPVKYFPYLANQISPPSPDESNDIIGMWNQVKSGEKEYDWSHFMGFINDITPNQYDELFGDLPKSDQFITKLNSFFNHNKSSENSLTHNGQGLFNLYVTSANQALDKDTILKLVEADVKQRTACLAWGTFEDKMNVLQSLKYVIGEPVPTTNTDAADALSNASDFISDGCELDDHWKYCLNEACYTIACSFELQHWLMSQWYDLQFEFEFDFSLAYLIWNSAYDYEIYDLTCYIYIKDEER